MLLVGWGETRSYKCHQRSQAIREMTPSSSQAKAMNRMIEEYS